MVTGIFFLGRLWLWDICLSGVLLFGWLDVLVGFCFGKRGLYRGIMNKRGKRVKDKVKEIVETVEEHVEGDLFEELEDHR